MCLETESMDYKATLNLPKTDFPMKADLPAREPALLERWRSQGLWQRIQQQGAQRSRRYVLHDGPPYANGNIHIGHALNKTLKDIVVKYKTMSGFAAPYVPGWDCHGLPIEHALLKELKIHKSQISQSAFRVKAHEYAMRFVGLQREQFKRLGVLGDWDNPYLTLSREYEVGILESFRTLFQKGYIYRGLKPVNWCGKCETALAEAEVEYADHTSVSVYVKFALEDNPLLPPGAQLLIWTTTPWTLLANVAVAVHPDLEYVCVKTEEGILVVAAALLSPVLALRHCKEATVLKEVRGSALEGLGYAHPFLARTGRVVLASYVSRTDGTGLVHTAPGHGNEDYLTGQRYKLEMVMPVDSRGAFDGTAGEFAGQHVLEANAGIIQKLARIGALYFDTTLGHSYPHCWRCKSPVIFRATHQWFLSLEHDGLRERLLDAIERSVAWVPAAGKERIKAMVELRPDWCLSRQRYWGVPIPALVCKSCGYEALYTPVIDAFLKTVATEGTDSWFTHAIREFIPAGHACPKCAGTKFCAGTDILDVWFDSGVSSQSVLKKRAALGGVPAQLYLEGSDQHRGWFQASLIPGVCIDGKAPFETVLTHGFVVDGEGRKMSKSLGNVISPEDIIKNYGADLLRLWVASSDYNEDIRISKEILSRLSEAYRKVRNTARFILSNLYDFDPDTDRVSCGELRVIDRWILRRLETVRQSVCAAYDGFEFHKAYKGIYDFCNEDLSMRYLDMAKGRLYTFGARSPGRRAAQTVICEVLDVLVRLLAPLLAFTADEIWQNMPHAAADKDIPSVHLSPLRAVSPALRAPEGNSGEAGLDALLQLIPEVSKALEQLRVSGAIGSSFDAAINLLTNRHERYTFLTSLSSDCCEIFKVSQVTVDLAERTGAGFVQSLAVSDVAFQAVKAAGEKCPRCWNYATTIGSCAEHPALCANCVSAIKGACIEKETSRGKEDDPPQTGR